MSYSLPGVEKAESSFPDASVYDEESVVVLGRVPLSESF